MIFLILSLALSIPIGIIANLVTPKIGKVLSHFSASIRRKLQERKAREDTVINWLVNEVEAFRVYFIHEIIVSALFIIGSLVSISTAFILLAMSKLQSAVSEQLETMAISIMFALFSAVCIYFAMATLRKVERRFNEVAKRHGWITWKGRIWSEVQGKWIYPSSSKP